MPHGSPVRGGLRSAHFFLAVCLTAISARAQVSSLSNTGTLATPQDVAVISFLVGVGEVVTIQTWGFGGGVNAAGTSISPGGFDPLITLYSGIFPPTHIVLDGSGNPLANADILLNPPWSDVGNCPPAGLVQIGSNSHCGDLKMQVTVPAGYYTLVLSDASYLPAAIFDGGPVAEPFINLAGTQFQTCDPNANACISRNGNYAVDISIPDAILFAITKCDIDQNSSTDAIDVQLLINEALGKNAPVRDLNGDGVVDVVDVQIVIDAVLGRGCHAS